MSMAALVIRFMLYDPEQVCAIATRVQCRTEAGRIRCNAPLVALQRVMDEPSRSRRWGRVAKWGRAAFCAGCFEHCALEPSALSCAR